jgi:type II secretory pathway component PulF
MATYQYTARDDGGREVRGEVEAASPDEALQLLQQRGLHSVSVTPPTATQPGPPPRTLSAGEAEQLAQRIALLTASGLPLVTGLLAAAAESGSQRVAAALEWLAGEVRQGRSLEQALAAAQPILPRHIRGLLAAATRTGDLGTVLSELVAHQQRVGAMRTDVVLGLAYPIVVTCLAVLVFLLILIFPVGAFERLFKDFGMHLPFATVLLVWWHRHLPVVLLGGGAIAVAAFLGLRFGGGRAVWERVRKTIPVFGPLWHWAALAEWSNLLSVLIRQRVPLCEALRLSADGVADEDVRQFSLRLADGVAEGRPVTHMLAASRRGPVSLVPLVRWGEETGALVEAFATAREIMEARVRTRAMVLQSTLPPLLFPLIGCVFLFVVIALFLQLISLVQGLSQ